MLRRLRLECEVAIFRFYRAGGRGSPFIGNDRDRLASTDESSTIAIVSGGTTGYQEVRLVPRFFQDSAYRLCSLGETNLRDSQDRHGLCRAQNDCVELSGASSG